MGVSYFFGVQFAGTVVVGARDNSLTPWDEEHSDTLFPKPVDSARLAHPLVWQEKQRQKKEA